MKICLIFLLLCGLILISDQYQRIGSPLFIQNGINQYKCGTKQTGLITCNLWSFGKPPKESPSSPTSSNGKNEANLQWTFLSNRQQSVYISSILKLAIAETKSAISSQKRLIEIAFPEDRKSDLSSLETFLINRNFAKDFVNSFVGERGSKDVWVLLPDQKEAINAQNSWTSSSARNNPFTVTSIETALKKLKTGAGLEVLPPQLMIVVNPGFNIEEWINLAKLGYVLESLPFEEDKLKTKIIVLNGNLDRLRNGYYPGIFYPELAKVTKSFYSKFNAAFILRPISIDGDRTASYLIKTESSKDWQLWVRNQGNEYVLQLSYSKEPSPTDAWNGAKKLYAENINSEASL